VSAGLPLARLLEDQPDEPFTGVVAGFIPSVPGGEPTPAKPEAAYLSLMGARVKDRLEVKEHGGSVMVWVTDRAVIHVHSGDQAREFIRAFAYAAELLDQAAVPFGSESEPGR
jgi:hypothetical protein